MTCTDCRIEGADCLTADRVRVCSDCLYARVVKERDEARAEIASLKAELSPMLLAVATSTDERDIARAKAEMAYQRGAEAMREAAATAVYSGPTWLAVADIARAIREMPLPEDKP